MISRIHIAGLALAMALAGCSKHAGQDAGAAGGNGHVEEMGPEGGSNTTVTPVGNAENAPVGTTDNGNVLPGDENPNRPRAGGGQGNSSQ